MRKRIHKDELVCECIRGVRAKYSGISTQAENIEILCLGSSHADYGFCPSVFPGNAFNFGLTSQDLKISLEIVKGFAPMLPRLRNLVVFFSVFSPGSRLAKTTEAFRSLVCDEILHISASEGCRLDEKECAHIRKLCSQERRKDSRVDAFGFNDSMQGFEIPAEERARTHLRENLREPDQMAHLEKILLDSNGGGYEVLVVIPPARLDYREALPQKSELFRKLFALRERCGGFRIADFFDDDCFSSDDFVDTDHLNPKGAVKLSKKIADLLG